MKTQSIREYAGLILVVALFVGAGILRLNDYSFLTPDSALYLIWGNSFAHGQGLVDNTQPEPDRFVSRGVLYPVLLAPVEAVFPHFLVAAKVFTILLGGLALILLYIWLNRLLGKTSALGGTIILACNPLMLIYGSEVLSEMPFICFFLLALLLIDRMEVPENVYHGYYFGIVLVSIALLRDIGLTFLLAGLVYLVITKQYRHLLPVIMVNILILGLWFYRNQVLVHKTSYSQTGYLPWFVRHIGTPENTPFIREIIWRITTSGKLYIAQFGGMIFYPLFSTQQFDPLIQNGSFLYHLFSTAFSWGRYIVILFMLPLMITGIVQDVKTNKSAWFRLLGAFIYVFLVLCFPFNDIRYHVPLLPLFVFYIVTGMRFIKHASPLLAKKSPVYVIAALVICMVPNIAGTAEILRANIEYMNSPTQPWERMGDWIAKNLPENIIIACPAKDLAPQIGNRRMIMIDPASSLPDFETSVRDNGVVSIVTPMLAEGEMSYEMQMFRSKRFVYEPSYKAGALELWSVHSRLKEPGYASGQMVEMSESQKEIYLARLSIDEGEYSGADREFKSLQALHPDRADIAYQALVASAMLGNTANAGKFYQDIVSMPSYSGIYIFPAQRQLEAMNAVAFAEKSGGIQRLLRATQAASMYWRMGYGHRAEEIMNRYVQTDSTYFVGLLWGFHFNFQNGDLGNARKYLSVLEKIDSSNAVVKAFQQVMALSDSLKRITSNHAAAAFHLTIAGLYKQIELPEEAIDEAERALGADPHNTDAMLFLASMFERKSALRVAISYYNDVLAVDPANLDAKKGVENLLKQMK